MVKILSQPHGIRANDTINHAVQHTNHCYLNTRYDTLHTSSGVQTIQEFMKTLSNVYITINNFINLALKVFVSV